ncbi:MAG TPA: Ig-like domain-containing protein [Acidimicrobiales bacterium]|nr:Ig-like domain-containing protein [Acidimicrobiales bacterium]
MSVLSERRVYIPTLIALAVILVGVFAWQSSGSDGRRVETAVTNCPPLARNDAAFTAPNQPVTIDVLANDTDAEGDALILRVLRASEGTASVDDGGTPTDEGDDLVLYTPSASAQRAARIDYRIEDAAGGASTAEVIIAVTELGALPPGLRSADSTEPNGDVVRSECMRAADKADEEDEEAVTTTSFDETTTSIEDLEAGDPADGTSRSRLMTRRGATGRTTTTIRRSPTTVARSGGGSPPPSSPNSFDDTPPPTQRPTQTTRPSSSTPPTSNNDEPPCRDQKSCEEYWGDYQSPTTTRPRS